MFVAEPEPIIEQELIAVAQLDQETRRRLRPARGRHAGAAGDYPHLIRAQRLGVRKVTVQPFLRRIARRCARSLP